MSKYLYGASVQGIQGYIFETNRLKEIVGASKIVESINDINFKEKYKLSNQPKKILQISGNVVLSFDSEEDVKKVVKSFIKDVKEMAYGITISQAVVEYDDYRIGRGKLEAKLKAQRNIVDIPLDYHFSILKQNPRTAKPLVEETKERDKEVSYDISSQQKVERFEEFSKKEVGKQLATDDEKPIFEIEDLSNSKNKIAVIHADGNGLGNIVKDLSEDGLIDFSTKLNNATKVAVKSAIKYIKDKYGNFKQRTIILDGDDLTLICDATYALEFCSYFLNEFEKETKDIADGILNLTASAGIAYANEKFPLHYGVDLAETLCSYSKKDSRDINKKLPPSSLMFHNIQSSSVKSYDKFIQDELTLGQEEIRCDFGPYYLKKIEDKPLIGDFIETIKDFRKDGNPAGRLREWLTQLDINRTYADNELKRIKEITSWKSENLPKLYSGLSLDELIITKDDKEKTPIYDILEILSVEDIKEAKK